MPLKSKEEYLNDYLEKYNDLEKKGELWRLRVTQEEFMEAIEKGLAYFAGERKEASTLTPYHQQSNWKASISVMLMDKLTLEEAKEQTERNKLELRNRK